MNRIVACVKWGKEYDAGYVNILYASFARHSVEPFGFYCLTDDPTGLREEVGVVPLRDRSLVGWWSKIELFAHHPEFTDATIVYSDLDNVIVGPVDYLFTDCPGCTMMRYEHKAGYGHNSCLMRFEGNTLGYIFEDLVLSDIDHAVHNTEPDFKNHRYWGDQIWITEKMEELKIPVKHFIGVRRLAECYDRWPRKKKFIVPADCSVVTCHSPSQRPHKHQELSAYWRE